MKKAFTLAMLLLCLCTYAPVRAQASTDDDMRNELQQVGNRVARKLMECCGSGGRNLQADVDFEHVNTSKLLGEITVPMKVSWNGAWSGNYYWIRGQIIIHISTGKIEWQKINDGGGFSPGCSQGCIN